MLPRRNIGSTVAIELKLWAAVETET